MKTWKFSIQYSVFSILGRIIAIWGLSWYSCCHLNHSSCPGNAFSLIGGCLLVMAWTKFIGRVMENVVHVHEMAIMHDIC